MNVALRRAVTPDEFLTWEGQQELRWEFDGFEAVGMVGGTLAHSTISLNIGAELRSRLRGTPCRAFVEAAKIVVAGSIRYPDAFVVRGPNANDARLAENPVVVFEVASPSTEPTAQLVTPEIGVTLTLSDLYEGALDS